MLLVWLACGWLGLLLVCFWVWFGLVWFDGRLSSDRARSCFSIGSLPEAFGLVLQGSVAEKLSKALKRPGGDGLRLRGFALPQQNPQDCQNPDSNTIGHYLENLERVCEIEPTMG